MTVKRASCQSMSASVHTLGYFPATPKVMSMCVTFFLYKTNIKLLDMIFHIPSLLDRYRDLNLYCRVAARSFCTWIQTKVQPCGDFGDIYERFLTCQRIYSFILGQLELGNKNLHKPQRSHCPACSHNPSATRYLAADGNMSFKGKGKPSQIEPLYGTLYVQHDLTAAEIQDDKLYSKNCQKCSMYRADGNNLDSAATIEDSKLHHRGLFGTICKHRIPGDFIFMTHGGEAYIYCFKLITRALEDGTIKNLIAKYDIACNFARYLRVSVM